MEDDILKLIHIVCMKLKIGVILKMGQWSTNEQLRTS